MGNPEQLRSWLQSVKALQMQQDRSIDIQKPDSIYDVRFVRHSGRYADLRHYTYTSSISYADTSTRLGSGQPATGLLRLHPYAVLDVNQLACDGAPTELTLEPADCLDLHQCMYTVLHPQAPATASADLPPVSPWLAASRSTVERLAPDVYFASQGGRQIKRASVRVWEQALKQELHSWAAHHDDSTGQTAAESCSEGQAAAEQVLTRLKRLSGVQQQQAVSGEPSMAALLEELRQKDLLPVILFKMSQKGCRDMAGTAFVCIRPSILHAACAWRLHGFWCLLGVQLRSSSTGEMLTAESC